MDQLEDDDDLDYQPMEEDTTELTGEVSFACVEAISLAEEHAKWPLIDEVVRAS
jgi:hypothetical protein